jgi:hypothetical protein
MVTELPRLLLLLLLLLLLVAVLSITVTLQGRKFVLEKRLLLDSETCLASVRFEVFTAVSMTLILLWVLAPCNFAGRCQ